jgi:YaaC-like Protein
MYPEESVEEIWSRLALFQSRDVLERRYKAHHGGELSAGKADEIIAHLQQARQYFLSAESAGVLAGPLEQYYGVLAFARAIVLYRQPRQREATLTRSHGLEAVLPDGGIAEDIQITVTHGTFHELLEATGNTETISIDQPSPGRATTAQRFVQSLPSPALGARFSLVHLLARIPGVKEHFEQAFGIVAHCHYGRAHIFQGSFCTTVWRGEFALPPLEELKQSLGISVSASGSVTPNDSIDFRVQLKPGDRLPDHFPSVVELESSAHVFLERFPGGWSLSRIASYFAASHAMSMLVRYHPTRWAKLVNHAPGDKLMPVLDRLRHLIQNDFVRIGLRELERVDDLARVDIP